MTPRRWYVNKPEEKPRAWYANKPEEAASWISYKVPDMYRHEDADRYIRRRVRIWRIKSALRRIGWLDVLGVVIVAASTWAVLAYLGGSR